MKFAKCLIFRINKQLFAIRTNTIFNIVEKPKLANSGPLKSYEKAMFSFRGMLIPLLDIKKLLGLSLVKGANEQSILVVELNINGYPELVGISIDEVIEVAEIDDLLTYPYCSVSSRERNSLRESILMRNGESIVMLNTSICFSKKILEHGSEISISLLSN